MTVSGSFAKDGFCKPKRCIDGEGAHIEQGPYFRRDFAVGEQAVAAACFW
jgi:hypothetical protein